MNNSAASKLEKIYHSSQLDFKLCPQEIILELPSADQMRYYLTAAPIYGLAWWLWEIIPYKSHVVQLEPFAHSPRCLKDEIYCKTHTFHLSRAAVMQDSWHVSQFATQLMLLIRHSFVDIAQASLRGES